MSVPRAVDLGGDDFSSLFLTGSVEQRTSKTLHESSFINQYLLHLPRGFFFGFFRGECLRIWCVGKHEQRRKRLLRFHCWLERAGGVFQVYRDNLPTLG